MYMSLMMCFFAFSFTFSKLIFVILRAPKCLKSSISQKCLYSGENGWCNSFHIAENRTTDKIFLCIIFWEENKLFFNFLEKFFAQIA